MAKNDGPQQQFKKGRFGAVWAWAKGHFHRWVAAHNWAARRVKIARDPQSKQAFEHARHEYGKKAEAHKRHAHKHDDQGWPADMHIVELFNNDNGLHNHLHVASTDRDDLIRLGNIAVAHYGAAGMVREFPPFDPVECVHATTSWHYRDSSNPSVARTCANRGNGLAFDLGCAARQAFGNEVKARYGADRCDF